MSYDTKCYDLAFRSELLSDEHTDVTKGVE